MDDKMMREIISSLHPVRAASADDVKALLKITLRLSEGLMDSLSGVVGLLEESNHALSAMLAALMRLLANKNVLDADDLRRFSDLVQQVSQESKAGQAVDEAFGLPATPLSEVRQAMARFRTLTDAKISR